MTGDDTKARPGSRYPLAGMRVVDCTAYLAGPYCTMILANLGADVIKVEKIGGDAHRKRRQKPEDEPIPFHMANHNKRSLALDIKQPEGKEALHSVIRTADIFVQNFRPGVAERMGLGYQALKALRPDLIYCSISGFGNKPPYGGMAGVDLVVQAMGGIMSVTGETDGPPVRPGYPVADMGAGMWAVIGILGAHARRASTGLGDTVDVSMFDGMIAWSIWSMSEYLMTGSMPKRMGSAHQFMAPYEYFEASDGKLVTICGGSDEHWPLLCKLLAMPGLLADERFSSSYKRYEHRTELFALIVPKIKSKPSRYWLENLNAAGIPGGPVLDIAELAHDEHVLKNGMLVSVDGFRKPVQIVSSPVIFGQSPVPKLARAPETGEHTVAVLREAGLSDAQIKTLEEKRAIGVHRPAK